MLEIKKFKPNAKKVIEWIDQYFKNIQTYPVKSKVKPKDIYNQIPALPPADSEDIELILEDLDKIIIPGITHWQHPNFHAYFPANSSVESILGEFITSALGAQCMIWETSPAAAELEERMMEWLKGLIGLPRHFEGVIQDSASSASLVAILTAREARTNFKSNEDGVPNNLRVYCSNQTHSSIEKAVGISGIGKKNLVKINVDDQFRLIPALLETQIASDLKEELIPCCVIATIGTTGTLAVDPLKEIAAICKKHKVWLHVDAAYAGSALILPEYRWMTEGIEQVDSFVFNPHKWLFTNFDCSAYFVNDANVLLKTLEVLPEYLKTKTRGQVNDYRDWGVPLGRRFRSLKLWFVIRSFGVEGLQKKLRAHMGLNEYFAREIKKIPGLELVLEPFLNFTCFRYRPRDISDQEALNSLNEQFLENINLSGEIFLTHTKINGDYVLRMIIGQTYVEKKHIAKALNVISREQLNLSKKN